MIISILKNPFKRIFKNKLFLNVEICCVKLYKLNRGTIFKIPVRDSKSR